MITKEDLLQYSLVNEATAESIMKNHYTYIPQNEYVSRAADLFWALAKPVGGGWELYFTGKLKDGVKHIPPGCCSTKDMLDMVEAKWAEFYEALPEDKKQTIVPAYVPSAIKPLPPATTLDFNDLPI